MVISFRLTESHRSENIRLAGNPIALSKLPTTCAQTSPDCFAKTHAEREGLLQIFQISQVLMPAGCLLVFLEVFKINEIHGNPLYIYSGVRRITL